MSWTKCGLNGPVSVTEVSWLAPIVATSLNGLAACLRRVIEDDAILRGAAGGMQGPEAGVTETQVEGAEAQASLPLGKAVT